MQKKLIPALVAALMPCVAMALPTGITAVTPGVSATLVSSTQLDITNGATGGRGIANFSTFNIASGEVVNVLQSPGNAFLARIGDANPTQIFGSLQSPGQVWLVNNNGFVFGSGATINVGGLVASSLAVPDNQFLSGGPVNAVGAATVGAIDVQSGASISASSGGFIHLVAAEISNAGLISAPNGTISMTAAHDVTLDTGAVTAPVVNTDARDAAVPLNEGPGGAAMSGSVFAGGTIQASTAIAENGKIYLRAANGVSMTGAVNAGSGAGSEITSRAVKGNVDTSGTSIAADTVRLKSDQAAINQTAGMIKATHMHAQSATSINLASLTNVLDNIEQATTSGNAIVKGTGNMMINGSVMASAAGYAMVYTDNGNITLSASGDVSGYTGAYIATPGIFTNQSTNPLAVNGGIGRFIIYSNDVTADTKGALSGGNLYGRPYTGHDPFSADMASHGGNQFVHIVSPTLAISANSGSKTYGAADPALGGYSYSGLVGGDAIGNVLSGSLAARQAGENVGQGSCGGGYCVNQGTLADNLGYTINFVAGKLDILPKSLTISAVSDSKVFDGTLLSSGIPIVGAGLVGGDGVTGLTQRFTSSTPAGSGGSVINVATYTINDGNGGANYSVTLLPATGTISPVPAPPPPAGGAGGGNDISVIERISKDILVAEFDDEKIRMGMHSHIRHELNRFSRRDDDGDQSVDESVRECR